MSRYKRVIGDPSRSRDEACRVTEVAIAVKLLNCINELDQVEFARVARSTLRRPPRAFTR
jgi:hypothetical protein